MVPIMHPSTDFMFTSKPSSSLYLMPYVSHFHPNYHLHHQPSLLQAQ